MIYYQHIDYLLTINKGGAAQKRGRGSKGFFGGGTSPPPPARDPRALPRGGFGASSPKINKSGGVQPPQIPQNSPKIPDKKSQNSLWTPKVTPSFWHVPRAGTNWEVLGGTGRYWEPVLVLPWVLGSPLLVRVGVSWSRSGSPLGAPGGPTGGSKVGDPRPRGPQLGEGTG